ncbi:hypothetical protein HK101_007426 [Irineochytrium annulatum]|nr:hypothetical protein HK101_007426 [Irineochytrium annulatum]
MQMHVQSSKYRGFWHFPRGKGLQEKREEVNADGVARVKAAMREECELAGKDPPALEDASFINAEEQLTLCKFYETKISDYCRVFKFDTDGTVQSTAITFFKRFYLANTIMDYDPKLILLTCLFLAAKVENAHIPLADFLAKVPKAPAPQTILDLEFVLCRGLQFQFMVVNLKWPLHGLFLDMQAYLLAKHGQLKPQDLKEDFAKLTETYLTSQKLAILSLHSDLSLTHYPSQVAMACLLLASNGTNFRAEVERYVTFRLEEPLGEPERVVELKVLMEEVVKSIEIVRGWQPVKSEAKRIDDKLAGCRNPEFVVDSGVYKKRKQEEVEEREAKRQKKVKKEETELEAVETVMDAPKGER